MKTIFVYSGKSVCGVGKGLDSQILSDCCLLGVKLYEIAFTQLLFLHSKVEFLSSIMYGYTFSSYFHNMLSGSCIVFYWKETTKHE